MTGGETASASPRKSARSAFGILVLGVVATASATQAVSGPAVNQFEVKDLESGSGEFEFQSQNAWSTGQPRRRSFETSPGQYLYDDNSVARQREALEVQMGITDFFRVRIGIEFEQERIDDPASFAEADTMGPLKLDEVALEGVVVFVKPKPEGIGLGLLVEYGNPVNAGPEEPAELYVGPIIEAHTGPWSLIANLAFVRPLGGSPEDGDDDFVRDQKWDFAYFLQGQYQVSKSLGLALEAYGTIDRIGNTGTRSEENLVFGDMNQHRAGPILYYTFFPGSAGTGDEISARAARIADGEEEKEVSVTVGAGALFGLNEHTPDTTYKLSVELEF